MHMNMCSRGLSHGAGHALGGEVLCTGFMSSSVSGSWSLWACIREAVVSRGIPWGGGSKWCRRQLVSFTQLHKQVAGFIVWILKWKKNTKKPNIVSKFVCVYYSISPPADKSISRPANLNTVTQSAGTIRNWQRVKCVSNFRHVNAQ